MEIKVIDYKCTNNCRYIADKLYSNHGAFFGGWGVGGSNSFKWYFKILFASFQ